jgi:hypothetical protein
MITGTVGDILAGMLVFIMGCACVLFVGLLVFCSVHLIQEIRCELGRRL